MANDKEHGKEKSTEETTEEESDATLTEGSDVEESTVDSADEKAETVDTSDEADKEEEAADEAEVAEVAASEEEEEEEAASDDDEEEEVERTEVVAAGDDADKVVPPLSTESEPPGDIKGIAAFFDLPDELMLAAAHTRDSEYEDFEAYSPFPIHGMDDAMGLGRSWIPWVTFGAGTAGLLIAIALQFGTMTYDWPMIIGGKPYAPWPSFVPIMFELTVLLAGVTSAAVMLVAAGCFKKPFIIDREITQDRFALWISAEDEAFDADKVREFMKGLDPVEIRTVTKGA